MNTTLWDAGLQNERTTLSWQRTALGLLVTGLFVARTWFEHAAMAVSLAVGSAVLSVTVVVFSRSRYAVTVGRRPSPLSRSSRLMAVIAGGTAVLGAAVLGELLTDLV